MDREMMRVVWPHHPQAEIDAAADILRAGLMNMHSPGARENTALETEWAAHVGLPHALTVVNGTVGLEMAVRALSPPPQSLGWEAIVPARTFIATASAVAANGGHVVVADIDASSLCVSSETLEARRTARTVGVIVVHYAGLPVPRMNEIVRWCWSHGLWLIEDCSHAHGAPVGRQSHIAVWSCCVGKNLSTGGEGGLVACLDARLAETMRRWRDHGRDGAVADGTQWVGRSETWGSNARMTEVQAVLGRFGLRRLAAETERRRVIAAAYDAAIADVSPPGPASTSHAYWQYLFQTGERDAVMAALRARGIPARVGGGNIHDEPVLRGRWSCPVADRVQKRLIALPCVATMSDVDVERVCQALREVLG